MEYLELTTAFFPDDEYTFIPAGEQPKKDYSVDSVSGLLQLAEANSNRAETTDRAKKVRALTDLARNRRPEPRASGDALSTLMRKVR